MGATVRKKKGTDDYYVHIHHQGKRKAKKVGPDKKAAERLAEKIEASLAEGDLGLLEKKAPTIQVYGQQYIEGRSSIADNTEISYNSNFKNHILTHPIASKPINTIEPKDVARWLQDLKAKGASASSIRLYKTVMNQILDQAEFEGLIKSNPCRAATQHLMKKKTRKKRAESKKEINPYNAKEAQATIDKAAELCENSLDEALITILFRTGIRVGEALGLLWEDIDWEDRTIYIQRQWLTKQRKYEETKNGKKRTVRMSQGTASVLRRWHEESGQPPKGVVFPGHGNPEEPSVYQGLVRRFKRYSKLAGVDPKKSNLHNCRHTYASLRIAAGHSVLDVSKQLGHEKVSMTIDIYAHWMPGHHESEVEELDFMHLDATQPQPEIGATDLTHLKH